MPTEDADRDVQLVGILENRRARDEAGEYGAGIGFGNQDLEQEAAGDGGDQHDDERLEQPKALVLHVEDDEHVERRDRDPPRERNAEQEVQGDRRADHFGEVARGDRDLADHPQEKRHRPRVVVTARLGQVATGHDAELGRKALQQNRHQVGQQNDGEECVPEARAPREIGGPVAGIHVADGDEIPGPCKGERFLPPGTRLDRDGAIDFRQARREPRVTPAGVEDAIRHRQAGRGAAARAPGPRPASCRRPCARSWDH